MQQEHGQPSMVEKGCDRCREWQEHYYWKHMDVSRIRFFKLMAGDFTHRISIPEKFSKNFKGQITGGFELKGPSGETWHISVENNDEEQFLVSGWVDFVKAHELQENDLLLFTCSGESSFDVIVIKASGFQRVPSLFGNRVGPDMCKQFNDAAGQHGKHYCLSDSQDTTRPSQLARSSPHNATSSKKSSGKARPSEPESQNTSNFVANHVVHGKEANSDDEYNNSNYYYPMFSRLSDEEKEEIIALASIGPNNPAFVTVLTDKHVQRKNNNLIVPCKFAADHLEERSHDITLRRPNRKEKWIVSYYYSGRFRCIRNSPLFKFVRENKLREGDICIFELMKGKRRVSMTVHVIRKSNDQFIVIG